MIIIIDIRQFFRVHHIKDDADDKAILTFMATLH